MRLLNFIACSLLQTFFQFILFQYIACDCVFPYDKFRSGKIIYQHQSVKETSDNDLHTLQFECNPGFKLKGRGYAHCADNKWIPGIPYCARIKSCADPGVSRFGRRTGDYCLQESLQYECREGYELVGEPLISCLPTGNWSSLRPLCKPLFEKHCELPRSIPHGRIEGDKEGDYFLPGDEAYILCGPGYKCHGPQFVFCEEGGVWGSEFGECKEVFCDAPLPLANGAILESTNLTSIQSSNLISFPYNFELTYVCDKNYRLIGDSRRVCWKRGTWFGKAPYCEVIQCPDPGFPENGFRVRNSYSVGSVVHYGCSHGYNLLGSVERHCLTNGQWSGELTRCDWPNNYCPNPGIPINGLKNSTNYDLGSKITFHCQDGYAQLGSEFRECLNDHTWSGTETKCLGRYDFDSEASIREKLKNLIEQIRLGTFQKPGRRRILMYFVFDVAKSVGRRNFNRGIEFAKAIVKKVGISKDGARAGALTFGSGIEAHFFPVHYETTEEVLLGLDSIEYKDESLTVSSPFTSIRRDIVSLMHALFGKDISSIIFFITDGKRNMSGNPVEEADFLKRDGFKIYCIGITGDMRARTLYDIASKSEDEDGAEYSNAFILQNYMTLSWLSQEIANGDTVTTKILDYSQCGLGMENVGQQSKDPWPWMASIFMSIKEEIPPKYKLKCGGSIIHRHFILTAAHCIYQERDKKSIIIKLGLLYQKNESFVQESEILNVFIHPKYLPGVSYDYDIALLQMEKPAEYNAYVRPICLPPKELPDNSPLYKPNSPAWATGWSHNTRITGNDTFKPRTTVKLRLRYLPIQSKERCIESVRSNGANVALFTDRMFCAGDGSGGNDTCQGDSGGGPLMQIHINPEGYIYWTQVGIDSWIMGCGMPNLYGYYTYLLKFVPWVDETIENALKAMDI